MKQIMSVEVLKEIINKLDNTSQVLIDRTEIFIITKNETIEGLHDILLDEIRNGDIK